MNSYYRLAATIQRDRGNFEQAYLLANEGVRLAKDIGRDPYTSQIIAASLYTRGVVKLAWGAFGSHVRQGKVLPQKDKLEAALTDFERAVIHASPQLKGIIYSDTWGDSLRKSFPRNSEQDFSVSCKEVLVFTAILSFFTV